ncbi:MAG: SOS response-associated peptidase family protein [Pyrinomonadaceae bacterium]
MNEWDKRKPPVWFFMGNRLPFALAGLWDTWRSPDGEVKNFCPIITTEANARLRPVHERMPVIIEQG